MEIKLLEIRDRATFFVVLCVNMNPKNAYQRKALRTYGYPCDGRPNIMLTHVNGGKYANNDPYYWGDRTYAIAHNYITENWDKIQESDVIDVEFINGETKEIKFSELTI